MLRRDIEGKTIGINGNFLPYGIYCSVKDKYKPKKIADVSKCLAKARLVKNRHEIEAIRKAAK